MHISRWLNFVAHVCNEISNMILNEASQKLMVTFVLERERSIEL
jgi:hypothetical protein